MEKIKKSAGIPLIVNNYVFLTDERLSKLTHYWGGKKKKRKNKTNKQTKATVARTFRSCCIRTRIRGPLGRVLLVRGIFCYVKSESDV